VDVDVNQLRFLQEKGFSGKQIAAQLQCSCSLVYKHLSTAGTPMRKKYADISDADLQEKVSLLHSHHPNSGAEVRSPLQVLYICPFVN